MKAKKISSRTYVFEDKLTISISETDYNFLSVPREERVSEIYLASQKERCPTEKGPRFKVSSAGPEKRGIHLAMPRLVV